MLTAWKNMDDRSKVSFINPAEHMEQGLTILVWVMIMMKIWVVMTLICSCNLTISIATNYFMTGEVYLMTFICFCFVKPFILYATAIFFLLQLTCYV